MDLLIVLLGLVVIVGGFMVFVYNSLIVLRNKSDEGWADIDTQLKRRYDLIPNLVETVKGYATHEKSTFEEVTKARSMAMSATTPDQKAKAENFLTGTLKSLFALAENYPELKANQNFLDLQNTLTEIEEHIQMSRRYYNGTVRDFNTKLQVFPNNVIAGVLGFKAKEYFEADEKEKKNVKVSFKEEEKPAAPAAPAPEKPAEEKPKTEEPEVIAEKPPKEEKPPAEKEAPIEEKKAEETVPAKESEVTEKPKTEETTSEKPKAEEETSAEPVEEKKPAEETPTETPEEPKEGEEDKPKAE